MLKQRYKTFQIVKKRKITVKNGTIIKTRFKLK